jgi:glycosyltransferase involved in cell wall biosynthesis
MQHVWPLLQKQENTSRLQIVGLSSKDDLLSSIIGDSVSVALNAPSVLPYYDSSSLVIVPIRVGGGTRIKLLEAFACRRPVVSTTIGAEGIDARAGEHLFLADSPQEFADACIKALNDYPLCRQMTEKSLDLVRERYDTSVVAARIGELFS